MGRQDESLNINKTENLPTSKSVFFMSAGSLPRLQRRLSSPAGIILLRTMEGYILAWRKFTETSFYKNSYAFHLAMHLLFRANHKEKKILFNGQEVEIKRGQAIIGRHTIAEETGIAEGTVYDKLKILEKCGFCNIKSNNRFSIVTILNYDSYQSNNKVRQQQKQQPANNQATTSQQPSNTNNNDKNDKNENNDKEEDTVTEFFSYFLLKTKKAFKLTHENSDLINRRLKEGYTIEQLKQAVDNFIQDDWPERAKHLDLIYCIGKQRGKPDALEKWLNFKPKKEVRYD